MALSIGELVGYVKLDDSEMDSGLSGVGAKLKGAAGSWKGLLGAAGAAAGVAYGATLGAAMSNEVGTDRLAAALGAGTKEAARLGKVAGDVYAGGWGAGMDDVNAAVEAVYTSIDGMAEASAGELQSATQTAMDFATAMQVDVARAAQVAGQMVSTGLASNATEAFDLLTAASSKVPVALREDLLDATDEYGQFFQAVGIGGEQAMSMLVAASEKGMYGIDKTGDAIKEFTIRATDMSAASQEAYAAIGMDAEAMTNKLLAGGATAGKATQQIIDGLLGIKDPAKQSQAALALFGTPLEDLNTQEIPKFLESLQAGAGELGKVDGAAARMGQTLNDNAMTNLTSFGRQLKVQAIDLLGGKLLPAVTAVSGVLATQLGPALDVAGAALAAVGGFIAEHSTAFQVLGVAIATFLVPNLILMGTTAMVNAYKVVVAWTMQQVAAAKTLATTTMTALRYVALFALMGAQAMMHAARMAAAWVVAMGPIGWAIAAVVGVVALVIANWDKVKAATIAVWNAVSGAVKSAWQAIKGAVSSAVAAVVGAVQSGMDKAKSVITSVWNAVKSTTSSVWNAIKSAVSAAINAVKAVVSAQVNATKAVLTAAWNAVRSATTAVWNALKGIVSGAMNAVKAAVTAAGQAVVNGLRNAWNTAKNAVQGGVDGILSLVRSLPGKIVGALGNLGSLLWNAGKSVMQGLLDGITAGIGAVKDKLSSVTGLIPDWKGPMEVDARLLVDNGRAIMQSLVDGFGQGVPLVEGALRGLTAGLPGMVPAPAGGAPAPGRDDTALLDAVDALRSEVRSWRRERRRKDRTT